MQRLSLCVITVLVASYGLAAAALAGPGDPTPTPTATPVEQEASVSPLPDAEETATPAPTPQQATPSATPTPTPAPTPSPTVTVPGKAELLVASRAPQLSRVGSEIDFVITVTNRGTTPAERVVVKDRVPAELDVAGVPILDGLASQNLIAVGNDETIVWELFELAPGQTRRLPWFAVAQRPGDFVASNEIEGSSLNAPATSGASRTFLADSGAVVAAKTVDGPRPPKVKRRRVVRYVERTITRERPATGPETSTGSTMPATGADPVAWVGFAGLLLLVGGALAVIAARDRSRRMPLLAILGAALLTACVASSTNDGPSANVSPSASESDRVLGERVERGDDNGSGGGDEAGDGADEGRDGDSGDDRGTGDDATDGPSDGASPELETITTFVPVVVEEEVRVPAAAPVELGSIAGDNALTFTWDEAGHEVTTATSSRTFDPDAITSLEVRQEVGRTLSSPVVLTNVSDGDVQVTGRLTLTLSGSAGAVTLTSSSIDEVLAPGGSVTAGFGYLLPSGTYSVTASFEGS